MYNCSIHLNFCHITVVLIDLPNCLLTLYFSIQLLNLILLNTVKTYFFCSFELLNLHSLAPYLSFILYTCESVCLKLFVAAHDKLLYNDHPLYSNL